VTPEEGHGHGWRDEEYRARMRGGRAPRKAPPQASTRCSDAPHPQLLQGVAEFNAGMYYQCHETLEHLWLQERDPVRYLYQGILQVGVGLYHLDRGNWRGAVNKLEDGLAKLEVFRPRCQGLDIERLVVAAARCRQALLAGGPGAVTGFDRSAYPKIERV
jgi:hypothetical protein